MAQPRVCNLNGLTEAPVERFGVVVGPLPCVKLAQQLGSDPRQPETIVVVHHFKEPFPTLRLDSDRFAPRLSSENKNKRRFDL